MRAVGMLAQFEIRRRWRRVVVLTLLVGLIGAIVLSTVAGARRSASALERFNASSRSAELEVTVGDPTASQLREFGRAPGVQAVAPLRGIALEFPRARNLPAVAEALDARFDTVVDRPRVVAGRLANPNAPDEATIGETLAARLHLGVGSVLEGQAHSPAQIQLCLANGCSGSTAPDGARFRLRIVGIVRRPLDLGDRGAAGGVLVLNPAFTKKYGPEIGSWGGDVLRVRTGNGAVDVPRVAQAARRIFGKSPAFGVQDLAIDTQGAQSAIDVLTVALWVFAGVATLAGLVTITIVLSREISLTAIDQTTQSALGLTRRQRMAVTGFQAVPIALGGALLAVVGAALASPIFPIGVARRADPDPGFRIDGTALAIGALIVAVAILLIACIAAFRTTRLGAARPERGRTTAVVAAAARAGLTPIATTGVRMALEPGRGRRTVPVRSAIFGAVFAVTGMVTVLMFASSLDRLVATPARYGWTWSFAAVPDARSVVGPRSPLLREAGLAAAEELDTVNLELDGHPVQAWGFRSMRGTIGPEIVAGRMPIGRSEIALGAATLDELGKRIGDRVHAEGPDGSHTYRIVGRAVFAKLDSPQPLANGAALTSGGLAHVLRPDDPQNGSPYVLIRVAPGARPASVERRLAATPDVERPFGPSVPVEVDRLRHVGWLAVTLGALLAALGLLAVGHALVTSVRRLRHDLAILKTLGFDRRQTRATVAWQATTLATVGLVIGIPMGIIVGGLVWRLVANGLGVSPTPAVPTLAVILVIPCAIAVVNLVAFFPGRAAARTRPAVALLSE